MKRPPNATSRTDSKLLGRELDCNKRGNYVETEVGPRFGTQRARPGLLRMSLTLSYAGIPPYRAVVALLINALIFGLSWWPFRALETLGLHALWATAVGYGSSVLVLSVMKPQAWRALLRYPGLWLLVLASGLTNVGFNWAVTTGDVVRVVLLFYLMPAWALLLAWPLLGERPNASAIWRLLLALAGLALVLKKPDQMWPVPDSLSDYLGLMGGFFFALTNVLLRRLNHTPDSARMLAMFVGGAVLAVLAAGLGMPLGIVSALPNHLGPWLPMAMLLGLTLLIANLALQYGAARLPSNVTAVVMLSEVLFASVSSVFLGAGTMGLRNLIGGGLILAASLLSVRAFNTQD